MMRDMEIGLIPEPCMTSSDCSIGGSDYKVCPLKEVFLVGV